MLGTYWNLDGNGILTQMKLPASCFPRPVSTPLGDSILRGGYLLDVGRMTWDIKGLLGSHATYIMGADVLHEFQAIVV